MKARAAAWMLLGALIAAVATAALEGPPPSTAPAFGPAPADFYAPLPDNVAETAPEVQGETHAIGSERGVHAGIMAF